MVFKVRVGEVSLSANGSGSLSIDIDAGKTFVIKKIAYSSTGNFKITDIRDSATGEHYLSGTLYSDQLKESGGNILKLDDAIELRGPTKLTIDVTDTSGSANTVSLAFYGAE